MLFGVGIRVEAAGGAAADKDIPKGSVQSVPRGVHPGGGVQTHGGGGQQVDRCIGEEGVALTLTLILF